jgi:hypothetical protein
MARDPETAKKALASTIATREKQAKKLWASAKNDGHPNDFNKARSAFETVKRAKDSLSKK